MGDLLRLVPFIIIVVVPFAEFGLPVLLKFFPNFLPSQFEKPELRQQAFKDSLAVKIEMQALLQETLTEMAEQAASSQSSSKEAKSEQQQLAVELDAMRAGETRLPPEAVLRVAALFKDEPSLDSMAHWQLAALAKYVGISPYGTDSMLRQNLKKSFADIKLDDQDLMREGTAYLNKKELKDACEARGMRAFGLTESQYRSQLDEWLMLAVTKKIPITLLLLSRAFQINNNTVEESAAAPQDAAKAVVAAEGLQQTIMSLDSAMVAEARLAPAAAAAASGANNAIEKAEIAKQKLLLIEQQNELIKAEAAETEAKAATLKASASSSASASAATSQKAAETKAPQEAKVDAVGVQKVVRMKASDATAAAAAVSKESVAMSSAPASLKALGASFAKERELLAKLRAVREQQMMKKSSGATSTSFLEAQLAKMGEQIEKEAKSKTLAGQLTQADADDDGSITRMELIAALRAASVGDEAAQAAALVERLDHEREGSLAIDDVERFLNSLGEKAAAAAKESAAPTVKEKKE
jgi:LETM1 and EF-hand domain-containing protein 1